MNPLRLAGAGLGLRRELVPALKSRVPDAIDFFELAPENWIDLGGAYGRDLRGFTERYPFVCHGLSLSLGGPSPLDEMLLVKTRQFMDAHGIQLYTEHLSYCSDDGHLYDLLPIPFTEEAVKHVAARIRRAQDILERRIAIENASYYTPSPIADMDEIAFIRALPTGRIVYMHVAGHYNEADNLLVDTHGADVIDPVWALLDASYRIHGVAPTLLERDFNIPPLGELVREVEHIARIQAQHQRHEHATPRFLNSSATSSPSPRTSAIPRRIRGRRAWARGA